MTSTAPRHPLAALAVLAALCATPAAAAPVVASYLNPDWADADKLHDFGDWGNNWWNDTHDFGQWNPDEQFADAKINAWSNPAYDSDLSCWIASAANMLAGFGIGGGNAQNMYWDMVYNMKLPWNNGKDGWQWGGWQHEALNWYLANRPHEGSYEVGYYGVYDTTRDGSSPLAWPTDPFDTAANLLADGYEIGVVVHGSIYHAITFEGYDNRASTVAITDSDDDPGNKDLNYFSYDRSGPTHWYLTDYAGGIGIDYFATLHRVPEPGSAALVVGALLALGAVRNKRCPEKRTTA